MLKRVEITDKYQFYLSMLNMIGLKTMLYSIILLMIRYLITGYLETKIIFITICASLFVFSVVEYLKSFKENNYHIKAITFSDDVLYLDLLFDRPNEVVELSNIQDLLVVKYGKKVSISQGEKKYVFSSTFSKVSIDKLIEVFKDCSVKVIFL